jgi:hypothetical protein
VSPYREPINPIPEPTTEQLVELGRRALEARKAWHAWNETQDRADKVGRDAQGRSPNHARWHAAEAREHKMASDLLGEPFIDLFGEEPF